MVTATIIGRLQAQEELSTGKAALAALRHSIGKPLGEVPAVWSIIFEDMPEKFLSCNGKETKAERAIYAALQLYAVQKQGRRGKENSDVAVPITKNDNNERKYNAQVVYPIISNGDTIGTVILMSKDSNVKMNEVEKKVAQSAATFLASQMEI